MLLFRPLATYFRLPAGASNCDDVPNKDDAALITHYLKHHKNTKIEELDIADALGLFFIEQAITEWLLKKLLKNTL